MNKTNIQASLSVLQKKAMESVFSSKSQSFVLKGYAGTGKTFLIAQLVKKLRDMDRPFVLMAPTGRAAKVLSQAAQAPAYTIHKTIYSMTDLKEYTEEDVTGADTFKFYYDLKNNENDARTIYMVDEASMLSDNYSEAEFFRFGSGLLLADLIEYINFDNNDHDKKLVLVGDPAQLPPVGSNFSPALNRDYIQEKYGISVDEIELTEVMRHVAESGILENATKIRNSIKSARLNVLNISSEKPDVIPVCHENLLEQYRKINGEKNHEQAIIVARTNQQVSEYNNMVRKHYFPDADGPTTGDRLLVVANNYQTSITLMNGDYIAIDAILSGMDQRVVTLRRKVNNQVKEKKINLCFLNIIALVESSNAEKIKISLTIIANILNSKERELSSDENKALYIDFKTRHPDLKSKTAEFKEAMRADKYFNSVRVKYGYAVTCHKAQGGEWPSVFVDFTSNTGYFNLDYFRWAYTAVTRAKNKLYALNAPHFNAITLAKNLSDEAQTHSVRSDVFILSAALAENENLLNENKNSFLTNMFLAISSILKNTGILIDSVKSHEYCEHYVFRRGDEYVKYIFNYNTDEKITYLAPAQQAAEGFTEELDVLLSQLRGKVIVVEEPGSLIENNNLDVPPVLNTEHKYMQEAYCALCEQIKEKFITILEAKIHSPYHLFCKFGRNGHTVGINYYFKGNGRLNKIAPVQHATTSDKLLNDLIKISNPELPMNKPASGD